MRPGVLALLLVLPTLLVPAVATASGDYTCVGQGAQRACAGDRYYYGPCDGSGRRGGGQTDVTVVFGVVFSVYGYSWCGSDSRGPHQGNGLVVVAGGPFVVSRVNWVQSDYPSGYRCYQQVGVSTPVGHAEPDLACPAGGPPEAEWGALLP